MRNKKRNKRNRKGLLMIRMGLLLIAAALFLVVYNCYEEQRAQKEAGWTLSKLESVIFPETAGESAIDQGTGTGLSGEKPSSVQEQTVIPDYILSPDMEMPMETIDGKAYIGILSLPSLGLELPVISKWSYSGLRTAPCRYSGSAYQNNLIICGHNYASHFGGLKRLREGDPAVFTDVDGNVFAYRMVEREILLPTSVEEMESGSWDLTLFTCTIGGQSRVTVRFEREDD